MNFQELKNKIIAGFWKMGYKLGSAVGTLGKSVVDEAFASGFKDTTFESLDIKTLLDDLEQSYENEISGMAKDSVSLADVTPDEFKTVFLRLFEENYNAAHSVFTSTGGWSVEYGSWDTSVDPKTYVASNNQDSHGGKNTLIRYHKMTDQFIVEITDVDIMGRILSVAVS